MPGRTRDESSARPETIASPHAASARRAVPGAAARRHTGIGRRESPWNAWSRRPGSRDGPRGAAAPPGLASDSSLETPWVREVAWAVGRVVLEIEPATDLRVPPITQPAGRVERRGFGVRRPSLSPASSRKGALRALEGAPPQGVLGKHAAR